MVRCQATFAFDGKTFEYSLERASDGREVVEQQEPKRKNVNGSQCQSVSNCGSKINSYTVRDVCTLSRGQHVVETSGPSLGASRV